jgi:thymidine kinase
MGDLTIPRPGTISMIKGPMFSGKTTQLGLYARRMKVAGLKVAIVKFKGDNRYNNDEPKMISHDRTETEAIPLDRIVDLPEQLILDADAILIDEGQFFPDLEQQCAILAEAYDKRIIVGGLSGTFERKPWERMANLEPLCTSICLLTAVCHVCKSPAPFSKKIAGDMNSVEEIGGADKYEARCGACWHK